MVVEAARYPSLFAGLIDDAAMFPPGNATVQEAVRAHEEYRRSWFAPLVGPLVVRDADLDRVGRSVVESADDARSAAVSVLVTGGVAGLDALAEWDTAGLEVGAVEIALRDADDLCGEASRVVAAALSLPERVTVFVEFPYLPGWEAAVDIVRRAGRFGKIRTGGPDAADTPPSAQLARQLAVLVGAGLPVKATAGLHHAVATSGGSLDRPSQHGFLNLLLAVGALLDGASEADAVGLLGCAEPAVLLAGIDAWSAAEIGRVRSAFRSFGCCGVTDPVGDLVALGLLGTHG